MSVQCVDLNTCTPPSERLAVPEKVVLVMGNSGCGKSTLTKHLSGHDEDMQSVLEGAGFLINGSRIGSSVTSVTQVGTEKGQLRACSSKPFD